MLYLFITWAIIVINNNNLYYDVTRKKNKTNRVQQTKFLYREEQSRINLCTLLGVARINW